MDKVLYKTIIFCGFLSFLGLSNAQGWTQGDHQLAEVLVDQSEGASLHDWGEWSYDTYCGKDRYVTGMDLKSQPYQGTHADVGLIFGSIFSFGITSMIYSGIHLYDDNALTGIELTCAKHWGLQYEESIYSKIMDTTSYCWSGYKYCRGGFVNGFQLKELKPQGSNDDMGVTNMKLFCSDGEILFTTLKYDPGEWRKPKMCPPGTVVCGMNNRVDDQSVDDRAGVTGLKLFCCKGRNLALACNANTEWETVFRFANNGYSPTQKGYSYKIGVSESKNSGYSNRVTDYFSVETAWSFEHSKSISFEALSSALQMKFQQSFTSSLTNENTFTASSTSNWDKERVHTVNINVYPGFETVIKQMKGSCGPFQVSSTIMRRDDHCILDQMTQEECDLKKRELHQKYFSTPYFHPTF